MISEVDLKRESDILEFTQKLFHSKNYKVSTEDDGYIIVNDSKNKRCIRFIIFGSEMDISNIDKCDEITGTSGIKKLLEIANHFGVTSIQLVDASKIKKGKLEFPLYLMQILVTGNSWYNKYGFISDIYKDELKNNLDLLKLTVGECLELYSIKFRDYYTDHNRAKIINEMQKNVVFFDINIQELSKIIINDYIKNPTTDSDNGLIEWFYYFVLMCEHVILYSADLNYNPIKKEEIEKNIVGSEIKGGRRFRKKSQNLRKKMYVRNTRRNNFIF